MKGIVVSILDSSWAKFSEEMKIKADDKVSQKYLLYIKLFTELVKKRKQILPKS
jgi:hypothetical protein